MSFANMKVVRFAPWNVGQSTMNSDFSCSPGNDSYKLPCAIRFTRVFHHAIQLLRDKLTTEQKSRVAAVLPTVRWNFEDIDLVVDLQLRQDLPDISIARQAVRDPAMQITINRETLHDSAWGRTSFGAAFLSGDLRIHGLPPLALTRFIPLMKHMLASYREALEQFDETSNA